KQTPGGSDLLRRFDGKWVRFKSALTGASASNAAIVQVEGGGMPLPMKRYSAFAVTRLAGQLCHYEDLAAKHITLCTSDAQASRIAAASDP
ncbi:hypothetical protein LL962_09725, partial [Xanthomonas sp. NCPPB 1067]|uniref:hypothetical protein n=1 Tax=Xanthomonas sp. NCPPB 1067 TaxID=487524 RepID=UPI001E407D72